MIGLHLLSQAAEVGVCECCGWIKTTGWEVPALIPAWLTALSPVVTTLTTAMGQSFPNTLS